MEDKNIVDIHIAGQVAEAKVDFIDGKLVAKIELSGKSVLDLIAAKIGGPIPAEIALFLESSLGLK